MVRSGSRSLLFACASALALAAALPALPVLAAEGMDHSQHAAAAAADPEPGGFFSRLFANDFMPHGHCYFWKPEIVWLHAGSDALITLSYYSIPLAMFYFIRKKKDVPFHWIGLLFAAFIFACGTTHLLEIWTMWNGTYRLSGLVKAVTAGISMVSAVAAFKVLPLALERPGPGELERRVRERTAKLKDAEERFRAVVEGAPNAMVMVDDSGRIALVNGQTERMFGYERDELIGRFIEMLVPERFRRRHPADRAGFFANPETRAMGEGRELFGLRKDRTEIPLEIGLNPVRTSQGMFVLASIIDITERKRTETAISDKNRELESLLYVTSHDLREPLRAVGNFTQMLSGRYADRLDDRGQDLLRRLERAGVRMQNLLDDILSLSRARKGGEAGPLDGRELVDEVLSLLEPSIRETGARITIENDLPRIRANRTWATQAVYNLVTNALKFSVNGDPPEIEIGTFRNPESGEAGFAVRDRGPGVAPESRERIFELFQRAVGRDTPGTGAGLAIVQEVCRQSGGRAFVLPREGGGSEFIITFARADKESVAHAAT